MISNSLILVFALLGAFRVYAAADPFLTAKYDSLHDSAMQRKLRQIRPVPVGVVFLPWAGMTEAQMREQFRTMKRLGFGNLKQVMGTPEWPERRVMEVAMEEGVTPFWYGDGGWEPMDAALLAKLGIPATLTPPELRAHPKMIEYQRGVLRRGLDAGKSMILETKSEPGAFRFTPDPFLHKEDVRHFSSWLRRTYASVQDLSKAWNEYEVGIARTPVTSWEDVEKLVASLAGETDGRGGYGLEYGRVRDVLRYKASTHAAELGRAARAFHERHPEIPTRTGGEMGLFLPFAYRATNMEWLADTQTETGSFYPSIHFAWHFGEVGYEVTRPIYMQVSFANDLFKGGWAGAWESTGGPQQLTGAKGWDFFDQTTMPGFTVNAGTITQLLLSYFAGGFKGAGIWTWNYRAAGWEGGEYALLDRTLQPGARAVRAGQIAQAANKYRDEIWAAHKEPLVGVLLNWDNDAIWTAISVRGRDHLRHYPMRARVGVSRALIDGNVPFEYVTVDDLRAGLGPRYPVIYLPGEISMSNELLGLLDAYVKQGGRVVADSPGGMYDESGKVLNTARGSVFESIFGAELADLQYSNNVVRKLAGRRLEGFVTELRPTRAKVTARFDTGEPAITEVAHGAGTAVLLGWDASFGLFRPGQTALEAYLRQAILAGTKPGYRCDGAIVYRIAAPEADHYFVLNDGDAVKVKLETPGYAYRHMSDAVTGEKLPLGGEFEVEASGGRWLRLEK